jgi:hypothetical protein
LIDTYALTEGRPDKLKNEAKSEEKTGGYQIESAPDIATGMNEPEFIRSAFP